MLKFNTKRGIYINSTKTNEFHPKVGMAFSYTWYQYAHLIGDTLYVAVMDKKGRKYSTTTARHFHELKKFLNSINYNLIEVYAPKGLNAAALTMPEDVDLKHIVESYISVRRETKNA